MKVSKPCWAGSVRKPRDNQRNSTGISSSLWNVYTLFFSLNFVLIKWKSGTYNYLRFRFASIEMWVSSPASLKFTGWIKLTAHDWLPFHWPFLHNRIVGIRYTIDFRNRRRCICASQIPNGETRSYLFDIRYEGNQQHRRLQCPNIPINPLPRRSQ